MSSQGSRIAISSPRTLLPVVIPRLCLALCLMMPGLAVAVDKIEVQGLFSRKAVLLIDGTRHILAVGETSPEGVRVISASSDAAILEVDGIQKEYRLGNTVSTSFSKRVERKEQIFRDPSGMYMTRGMINNQHVKFMVDTGATSIAMNEKQAKKLGIRYDLIGSPTRVSTASGFVNAYIVNLKKVSVGSITQSNVEAFIIEGNHPGPILLGMSFLGRVGVEQTRNVMTLKQK